MNRYRNDGKVEKIGLIKSKGTMIDVKEKKLINIMAIIEQQMIWREVGGWDKKIIIDTSKKRERTVKRRKWLK